MPMPKRMGWSRLWRAVRNLVWPIRSMNRGRFASASVALPGALHASGTHKHKCRFWSGRH
jgi:hypothetical protein